MKQTDDQPSFDPRRRQSPIIKPAHTPGPWWVRTGVCRNDHPDTSADVHGADGQFVADCGCHDTANTNARLIAAAPDLLAALKQIDALPSKLAGEAWAIARRAIAKAEGREP